MTTSPATRSHYLTFSEGMWQLFELCEYIKGEPGADVLILELSCQNKSLIGEVFALHNRPCLDDLLTKMSFSTATAVVEIINFTQQYAVAYHQAKIEGDHSFESVLVEIEKKLTGRVKKYLFYKNEQGLEKFVKALVFERTIATQMPEKQRLKIIRELEKTYL